ncbi:MAG: peroxidase-related enzyme [Alphaproteobacteria bacterium]|nr:peroxidase-related enzyme [Alphaproteobacteria bacterium]
MPFFPSMPEDANVRTIFAMAEDRFHGWHDLSEHLMRGDSEFSLEERELIAGYVSGVNACQYCHGVHSQVAIALGFPEDGFVKLMEDVEASGVDEKMKPVLKFVRKLTLEPAKMVQADADAVFAAGWSERALHDAITVCAMFNFMNRMLEGHGIKGDPATFAERGRMKAEVGYADRRPLNAEGKPEPTPAG